jgi:hypothetical protein
MKLNGGRRLPRIVMLVGVFQPTILAVWVGRHQMINR